MHLLPASRTAWRAPEDGGTAKQVSDFKLGIKKAECPKEPLLDLFMINRMSKY